MATKPLTDRGLFRRKPIDDIEEPVNGDTGLKRVMGTWQLTALSLGGLVGAGVFSLSGVVANQLAGPGVLISFVLAVLASAAAALCYAEFTSLIPKAGSAYTYAYAVLGEVVGWLIGWDLLLEYTAIVAVVAIGVSGYLSYLVQQLGFDLPDWMLGAPGTGSGHRIDLFAMLMCLLLAWILNRGAKSSARVETALVVMKVVLVLVVVVAGAFHIKGGNYTPFLPYGIGGAVTGAATAFFAVYGYDAMSAAAEETDDARKKMPKAILLSLGIATVIYVLVCVVLLGMQNYRDIDTQSPFSSALAAVGLPSLAIVVAVGAVLGITTSMFANMLAVTRVWFAMSRDGLLPKWFAKTHPVRKVPSRVTWIVGVVSALIAGLLPIREAAELTNIGILAAFMVVSIAVVVLRRRQPDLPRGFRCPWVPFVPAVGVAFSVWLVSQLDWVTWSRFLGWLVVGLVLYAGYGYRRSAMSGTPRK
ncbi:amino acid permease [Amycolatopsis sp. CA-230715]|uniref:amino acid permease n=1 Tax=Amycolatopsis sp. CA-230715 TaxID=2745196 RepID=UPI001C031A9A|nr:amino acid permease [Amycolatopsis sp. CA-230715]QWF78826.1 putative amino acid permease YhdG [Amycolatopsis sp. CA-230715]